MSYREQQKVESRERIVRSAVGRLRDRGLADASVAAIMADAGLTVGGFYAHFSSKEDLAVEAVGRAMSDRRRQFLDLPDEDGWRARLRSALRDYFAETHRDDVAGRCPMPMAAIDAVRARGTAPTFADEIAKMAAAFETGDAVGPRAPREASLGSLALMVGGMILAHATAGTPLSGEILESASRFGDAALRSLAEGDHAR